MVGRLHFGVHTELEAEADEILARHLSPLPASEKKDILTPWKERDRRSHEVYTREGVPRSTFEGNYHRSLNPAMPHLNNRESRAVRERGAARRRTDVYSGTLGETGGDPGDAD